MHHQFCIGESKLLRLRHVQMSNLFGEVVISNASVFRQPLKYDFIIRYGELDCGPHFSHVPMLMSLVM